MKVIHVFKTYLPDTHGGMEECIRQLCLQTSRHGVDNTVLTLSEMVSSREVSSRPECELIRFPVTVDMASTPMSISLFLQYKACIHGADLIHYHFPWPFADLLHVAHRIKTPYVLTYQSDIVKQATLKHAYAPLMKRFLSGAGAITVASPNYLESSVDLAPFKARCQIMPLGLDEKSYPEASADLLDHWRQRVGENFFLFVGVLRYYKGLQFLVDAIAGTGHRVVIAGRGPMEDKLKEQVRALGLESQVIFTGFLANEDKVALFHLCRAFVFPSHLRSEAYGIGLVEAAMYGRPMISCEIGTGTTFINQHKLTGLVVPPRDPAALRQAMNTLVEDARLSSEMGAAARKRYEEHFTASQMGDTCFDLYQEVLGH